MDVWFVSPAKHTRLVQRRRRPFSVTSMKNIAWMESEAIYFDPVHLARACGTCRQQISCSAPSGWPRALHESYLLFLTSLVRQLAVRTSFLVIATLLRSLVTRKCHDWCFTSIRASHHPISFHCVLKLLTSRPVSTPMSQERCQVHQREPSALFNFRSNPFCKSQVPTDSGIHSGPCPQYPS